MHQSMKRGTSENSILLGEYARNHLAGLSMKELKNYEALLSESDVDLFNWISGVRNLPKEHGSAKILASIREFIKTRGSF